MRSRQLSRLTCMVEILLAELADRLQLPVSGPGAPLFGDHQRLVHQLGQQVEQFDLLEGRVSADCLHSVEGETTREHRQPAQQNLLRFGEQFVAPFQGATQRLVPRDAAGSAAEHGQSIAQAAGRSRRVRVRRSWPRPIPGPAASRRAVGTSLITPCALSASSAKPGRTCAARSTKSRTEGRRPSTARSGASVRQGRGQGQ